MVLPALKAGLAILQAVGPAEVLLLDLQQEERRPVKAS